MSYVALIPAPRAGSARRPLADWPASPRSGWSSSLGARSGCARCRELGGADRDRRRPDRRRRPRARPRLVQREHGELHMLVNNAGAAWRGTVRRSGWANVERHMKLNFEAPVRLTEALLPLLRATAAARAADAAPARGIVNVASTAGRVARPARAATRRTSSRSPAGATRSTPRSARTACTSASSCPASSAPRASRPTNCGPRPDPEARVRARRRRRGDHRGRSRGQGRALRAALVLAGRGSADPGPVAGPPRDGGGWAGHRHQGRRRPARPLTRRLSADPPERSPGA